MYGERLITDEQAIKMAPRFGFTYDIIAGCIITEPLVNGVNSYNSVTTEYLKSKLGNDWKKRFDYSVDSLFNADKK